MDAVKEKWEDLSSEKKKLILFVFLPITLGTFAFILTLFSWTIPAHHNEKVYNSFTRSVCNVTEVVPTRVGADCKIDRIFMGSSPTHKLKLTDKCSCLEYDRDSHSHKSYGPCTVNESIMCWEERRPHGYVGTWAGEVRLVAPKQGHMMLSSVFLLAPIAPIIVGIYFLVDILYFERKRTERREATDAERAELIFRRNEYEEERRRRESRV